MAWWCYSLTLWWYALNREQVEQVIRERPWYKKTVGETFSQMLAALRLHLWKHRLFGEGENREVSLEMVENLLNEMVAVG